MVLSLAALEVKLDITILSRFAISVCQQWRSSHNSIIKMLVATFKLLFAFSVVINNSLSTQLTFHS